MLILGIIAFGVVIGWVARTVLGRSDLSWGRTILFGILGSFVGGLVVSLISGDGLALRPSGIIGSILGAIALILVDSRSPAGDGRRARDAVNRAPVDQAAVPSTAGEAGTVASHRRPSLCRSRLHPRRAQRGRHVGEADGARHRHLRRHRGPAGARTRTCPWRVATRVTDKVFAEVDVAKIVDEVLPDRAKALAPALVGVVERYAVQLVDGIIRSDQFETLWIEANRVAHTQIVRLLTGKLVSDETRGRAQEVVLNLQGVVEQVDTRCRSAASISSSTASRTNRPVSS